MGWILSGFADEAASRLDEQLSACAAGGLKHIDLRMLDGYNISELPLDVAESARRQLDAAGIRVGMLGSPIGKIDVSEDAQIDLDKLAHLGELAKVFECNRVRIFSYYNRTGWPENRWAGEALSRLQRLTEQAGDLGLVLFNENESDLFGETASRVEQIADACHDGQFFRLIFDFDNYNRAGEDVWQTWSRLGPRTDAFHLKDSTAPPESMHVPVGSGNGRVRDILADALRGGWSGLLSLEPHLVHSDAVAAIGRADPAHQRLKDLGAGACFQMALTAARQLLADIGADYE